MTDELAIIEYPEISQSGKRFRYDPDTPGLRLYESGTKWQEGKGIVRSVGRKPGKEILLLAHVGENRIADRLRRST